MVELGSRTLAQEAAAWEALPLTARTGEHRLCNSCQPRSQPHVGSARYCDRRTRALPGTVRLWQPAPGCALTLLHTPAESALALILLFDGWEFRPQELNLPDAESQR